MGNARARGTYDQRKAQAGGANRLGPQDPPVNWRYVARDFWTWWRLLTKIPKPKRSHNKRLARKRLRLLALRKRAGRELTWREVRILRKVGSGRSRLPDGLYGG